MDPNIALFYRDELREARAAVLKDAEAFLSVIYAIERLGAFAYGKIATLQKYRSDLIAIARHSALAEKVPGVAPGCHTAISDLYDLVQDARNEALHQGAYARHLADHAIELSLVLEDALVNGSKRVGDYMVKAPLCAEEWQPLSLVRQQMLTNAFSYLPIHLEEGSGSEWLLVSDLEIARYLRQGPPEGGRKARLAQSINHARHHGLQLPVARTVTPEEAVEDLLKDMPPLPVLVVGGPGHLIGIVTPFDLL